MASGPCHGLDVDLDASLESAACHESRVGKADALELRATARAPTNAPGADVVLEVVVTNQAKEPAVLHFFEQAFGVDVRDASGAPVDPPPGEPVELPNDVCARVDCAVREPPSTWISLAPGGKARGTAIWRAVALAWPPPRRRSCCGEHGPEPIAKGLLPPGDYRVRVTLLADGAPRAQSELTLTLTAAGTTHR